MVVLKPQIALNSVGATSCSPAVLWPTRGLWPRRKPLPSDLVVASHGHSGQWEWSADRSLRLVSGQPPIAWRKPKAFTFDAAGDRRPRCSTAQRAWAMSQPLESTQFTLQRLQLSLPLFSWHVNNRVLDSTSLQSPLSLEFIDLYPNTLHYNWSA